MEWKELILITLVSSAGLLCYLNTLKAGFVYDDNRAIVENSDIKPSTPWTSLWFNDFWGTPLSHSGSHKSYRPLCVLSFRFNYMLDGLNPRGYHLVNVLLHSITCGVFTLFALKLLGNFMQCVIAGLLFAVHPVHTEAVAGIVGRADVAAALFFILSMMFYQNACQSKTPRPKGFTNVGSFVLSMICCTAGTLTKELGITVLGVIIVYDVIFVADIKLNGASKMARKAITRGTFQRAIALSVTGGLLLYVRFALMDLSTPVFASSDNPASNHPDVIVRFLTFLYLPVVNFGLLLFPWQLSFDWSMESIPLITSVSDARNIASFFMYSCLVFFVYNFVKSKMIGFQNYSNETGESDTGLSNKAKQKRLRSKTSLPHNGNYYYRLPHDTFLPGCCKQTYTQQETACEPLQVNDVTLQSGTDVPKSSHIQNGVVKNCCKTNFIENGTHKQNGYHKQNGTFKQNLHANKQNPTGHVQQNAYFAQNGNMQNRFSVQNNGTTSLRKRFVKMDEGGWDENFKSVDRNQSLNMQTEFCDDFNIAALALAMVVIPFLPATNLMFYVGFVVAERILYIPSMGFCLLVALGFGKLWKNTRLLRPLLKISVVVMLGLYAARTVVRNEDWRNEESLYRSGIQVNPAKAWGNLASILTQKDKIVEAEQAYRKALEYRPNMADTQYNLGILLQNSKRYKEAIDCYKNAIKYRPSLASAYLNLGLVLNTIGLKEDAVKILSSAKNISDFGLKNPKAHLHSLVDIRYNLGKILFDMRKYKESVDMFHEAIKIAQQSYSSHSIYNMIGQAYSQLDQLELAEKWYLKSLEANKTHVPAHLTYARHLAKRGGTVEAEKWFLKAMKLQPNYPDTHLHFGQFLTSIGRLEDGLAELEKAVELNEHDAELAAFAASAFREFNDYAKAEVYYKKALMLNQDAAHHHMNLGALYHLTGRLDEAETSYLDALRLRPDDQLTMANIRKLRSVRKRADS